MPCACMVSVEKIEKNDFNLNIPRSIDSQPAEDIQDIEGNLKGSIPTRDNPLQQGQNRRILVK